MHSAPVPSDSRYESLTRPSPQFAWITDAQGHFTAPQPGWGECTGQAWEACRGLGWQKAVHADDLPAMWRNWRVASEQCAPYGAEGRIWHAPSGQYRQFEIRAVPSLDADGGIREWIGTCTDVHERRSNEQALRIADRRKDEFMAVLAHELRNPLAPIRNAVHVLKVCREDDARSAWARSIIERQVDQMSRLLDDLLDVTRIARGKLEVRRERIDLADPLERAIETSRPLLDAHGHAFQADLPAEALVVEGDPPRLAQVFANLLNNAAKYTDRGGRVTLGVRAEEGQAVVRVRDNGMGIAAAVLPNLFRIYTQAVPSRERAEGGLGIGLSLVRGLVEMHGGTVQAHSEGPGRGSEFVVRLPLVEQPQIRPARPAPVAEPPRLRVLVADDNPDAAQTLAVLLEVMGHEVRIAADGEEAVELAASFQPAAVLLDIGMPRMDGYAAARHIRDKLPGTLLVAVTGWGRREDVSQALKAGFDHHLVKPVGPEQVSKLLAQAVRAEAGR
ncbi:ATP-binding protein [Ramlibacter tataouinensis]|uniref:hybrid sensor histidine kinase/response regulator n=1 Tax=Ramlibacter tataouinensis TaxID=94132 RepID=UPI0022F3B687|nr:ATP-binding protein [Ramlibacter tataouinensis]WBY02671.1 ATP-binding protein [Ramlibacter tataouinensis]